jgi:PIN domain nuclease of toxin-antitoxin system
MQRGPFVFSDEWLNYFLIHSPQQVTSNQNIKVSELGLIEEEQQLIDNKSSFFPLQTISPSYFNQMQLGRMEKATNFLSQERKKYPLSKGKERRIALAEQFALSIYTADGVFKKFGLILKSVWYYPLNKALKHYIKMKFFGKR